MPAPALSFIASASPEAQKALKRLAKISSAGLDPEAGKEL